MSGSATFDTPADLTPTWPCLLRPSQALQSLRSSGLTARTCSSPLRMPSCGWGRSGANADVSLPLPHSAETQRAEGRLRQENYRDDGDSATPAPEARCRDRRAARDLLWVSHSLTVPSRLALRIPVPSGQKTTDVTARL